MRTKGRILAHDGAATRQVDVVGSTSERLVPAPGSPHKLPPPDGSPEAAAGDHAERFEILDGLLSARRPTEPHYHLAFLAVAPAVSGKVSARRCSPTTATGSTASNCPRGPTPPASARTSTSATATPRSKPSGCPAVTPMRRTPTAGSHPLDTISAAGGSQARGRGV
ncbi:hypothetical protein [Micromonospora sp. bgisy143]|uniref:hypothetical protein n=1 Tax=Micromonospora sp. bgisy143 TaxID=3413790 RepID=UPI003EBEB973